MANKDKVVVKGSDFDGAIFENAATEETLKSLVKALNSKEKGAGDKAQKLFNKALEKNIRYIEDSSEKHKQYIKDLESLSEKTKSFGNTLYDISGMAISGTFSLISSTGKSLVDFFNKGFNAFEKTNSVGASFNYNILELMKTAAEARMPIEEFTQFISENSKALAAFGGTVTEGAKAFSGIRDQFTDPTLNKELYNLGYNSENLNKILARQLQTEMISGRSRELDKTKFTKELKEYTKDLNVLSKVTGVSTDQLQEGVLQQLSDGRMMALQTKLTGKALINFRDGLALMNAELDPKVFDSLKNMMSGVIDPGDKFAKMLTVAAPGILEFQEALGEGRLDIEQQLRGYERQVGQIENFLGRFSKQQIARIPELKAMQEYLASIKKFTGSNGKAELEGRQAMDGIIGLFSSFGEIINRVKNLFLKAFVSSGTMKKIQDAFNKLAEIIQNKAPAIISKLEPVMNKAADWVDQLVDSISNFIDSFLRGDLKPENLWNWVRQTFSGAINVITEGISAVISGLLGQTPEQQLQKEAYKKATPEEQEKMRKENPALALPDVGGMFDKMTSGLKSLISMVPSLADLGKFFGVTAVGSVVAGAGLAAGMGFLANGLQKLVAPAWELTVPVGVLGGAFWAVSEAIKSVGDSFGKVIDFFKSMKEINADEIIKGTGAITLLGGAIASLGAGGIVNFLGSGGIDKLVDSLKKINDINIEKLTQAGPALKAFHEGVASFTGGGVLEALGDGIKEFAGGKGIESIVFSLSNLGKIDLSKLDSIGNVTTLLTSLKPFLDTNVSQKLPNSMNTVKDSLISFVKDTSESISKLTPSSVQVFVGFVDGLSKFSSVDVTKISNLSNSLTESFVNLNQINFDNANKNISSFAATISKLSNSDMVAVSNSIAEISKVNTTINDNLTNQSKGVDDYIKSIDKLSDSLTKLEKQLKDMPSIAKASVDNTASPSTRVIASSNPTSEMTTDDLQKQLNNKIDELIIHIVEMKQNTKDTADSVKGRRSAV